MEMYVDIYIEREREREKEGERGRERADKNSVWQILNYTPTHQIRQTGQKGGGIASFVHNNFDFKIIKRGNICNDDIE